MAYDDRAKAGAAKKLAPKAQGGKGQAVTLTRGSKGPYNPATGSAVPGSTTQQGSGLEESYKAFQIDGTKIMDGDKKFMLSPVTLDGSDIVLPRTGDRVTYESGKAWTVQMVEPFAPAGLLIFAYLHLRGA